MLLMFHIILMTLSLVATIGMVIAAISSVKVGRMFVRTNASVTTIGVLCGIALLIGQPIGAKCVALTAYVVVFAVAYGYVARQNQSLAVSSAS